MKWSSLYIFYILVYFVLPTIVIIVMTNWNTANRASTQNSDGTSSVLLLLVIPLLTSVTSVPKSNIIFERMGYRGANRAFLVLSIFRRFWGTATLAIFALYLWIWIDAKGMPLSNYFILHPDLSFAPISFIISLLSFTFTAIALSNWNGTSSFCLFMARELCKIASTTTNKVEKMTRLISSLQWYGRYIWIIVDLKIAEFDNLTARILSQNNEQQGKTIDSFYNAFVNGDELEPLQVLSTINEGKGGTSLLIRENLLFHIKKLAVLLGIIISAITALGSIVNIFIIPYLR